MGRALADRQSRRALILLGITTAAIAVVYASTRGASTAAQALISDATLFTAGAVSAFVIIRAARQPGAWDGMLPFGAAMGVLAFAKAIDFVDDLMEPQMNSQVHTDLSFLIIGAMFLLPARIQFREHFRRDDRREIAADVALIAVALIGVIYLLIRPVGPGQETATFIWSALFAATAAAAFTSFVALVLWVPTRSHLGQMLVVGIFAGATLTVGSLWIRGQEVWGFAGLDIPLLSASIGLAAMMVIRPDDDPHRRTATGGWGRQVLTTTAVAAAAISLGIVAAMEVKGAATIAEGSLLIGLLAAAIAGRVFIYQVRSTQANEETNRALTDKEAALGEADTAVARLREALDTLTSSEERLRLLFDAAVDGIVELDGNAFVRRTNGAFCQMVGLDRGFVVGRPWDAVASAIVGADDSLASLPQTGQGTLRREGHELFLEARTSPVPGTPPGQLMLVRDVTSAKVADQTIRSLFKFLQDRDEDRTRLQKRTNAAIEAERNRVARDLHDGPVQGVSAASLSLEAVLLMLRAGDQDRAMDTLGKVRNQLAEEADNLRRLMGNLRPPLLEERGLVPALQETLARFGREEEVETNFRSRSLVEVPADLETLAYRLVQEALSNAGKHAHAAEVSIAVDAVAGQLRVEVSDDGVGFDPNKARDFLRAGKVGLASMRERIELANGTFMVRSSAKSGTTIVATLPLEILPIPHELAGKQ